MNSTRHNANNSMSMKRLNLIRAAQELGIDKISFCNFLKTSIDVERQYLFTIGHVLSEQELKARNRAVMEADLVRLTLEHF